MLVLSVEKRVYMTSNNEEDYFEDCPNCGSPISIGHFEEGQWLVQPDETFQCEMCGSYVVVNTDAEHDRDDSDPLDVWLTEIDGPKHET